jgi:magnesium chelatase family protein
MLATTFTTAPSFASAKLITVEVNVSRGIKFHLVGMADTAVRESRQRMYTALRNNDYHWPGQRITVNLIPAGLKKSGTHLDLAMAIGILAASGQLPAGRLESYLFVGELSLGGDVREAQDVYNILALAKRSAFKGVVLHTSPENERLFEGAGVEMVSVKHLNDAVAFVRTGQKRAPKPYAQTANTDRYKRVHLCFSDVAGQRPLKRALAAAAAGGPHALVVGPPGCGKTMLASRMPSILPPINPQAKEEVLRIQSSVDGPILDTFNGMRPAISIGSGTSMSKLFGSKQEGGMYRRAFGGLLHLDELGTYSPALLDKLLEPMNGHDATILATMNPCRCGNYAHPSKSCSCSAASLDTYRKKISGALLDRFDIIITAQPELWQLSDEEVETSLRIQDQVERAWRIQIERQGCQNAQLEPDQLEAVMGFGKKEWRYLYALIAKEKLSTRSHHSLMALARTLADLNGIDSVKSEHLNMALAFRVLRQENVTTSKPAGNTERSKGNAQVIIAGKRIQLGGGKV